MSKSKITCVLFNLLIIFLRSCRKGAVFMSVKTRILCAVSALCFLGSVACFSGYAAELLNKPSGDEYTEPADPGYTDPGNTDPGNTDPGVTDPGTTEPDTSYSDPGYEDPGTTSEYTESYGEVVSEGNYTQPDVQQPYVDYASQYIAYTYEAQYDDNYYYVPTYTEPTESLIEVESEVMDTDELTSDDWKSIMLDLEQGNMADGTKTFNFIKNNKETEEDYSLMWMLYLGMGLIIAAVFIILFVVISSNKAKKNFKKYKTA